MMLAQELYLTWSSIDRFSTGGMLQATLETEFLQITLKAYETKASAAIFAQIYYLIEKAAVAAVDMTDAKMEQNLQLTKQYLENAKRQTGVQVLTL